MAKDAFALAEEATTQAIYGALAAKFEGVTAVLGSPTELELGSEAQGPISSWFDVFRICQVCVGFTSSLLPSNRVKIACVKVAWLDA